MVATSGHTDPVGEDCAYDIKLPDRAIGKHGNKKDYDFWSVSLVKRVKRGPHLYTRMLDNKHTDKLLPGEWTAAGLRWESVLPMKCYGNDLESKYAPKEVDTVVFYRPAKTGKLEKVPLLVPDRTPRKGDADTKAGEDDNPALNSSIRGSAGTETKGGLFVFRFRSSVTAENTVKYEAWVVGRKAVGDTGTTEEPPYTSLRFFTSSLTETALKKAGGKIQGTSRWDEVWIGKTAAYKAVEKSKEVEVKFEKMQLEERQILVELYPPEGNKSIGTGLISVYLPKAGAKKK
jgi:hypothetical protein